MSDKLVNRWLFRVVMVVCIPWLSVMNISASERPENNPREKQYIFWGYPDNYLTNQSREAFGLIDRVLKANKPAKETA